MSYYSYMHFLVTFVIYRCHLPYLVFGRLTRMLWLHPLVLTTYLGFLSYFLHGCYSYIPNSCKVVVNAQQRPLVVYNLPYINTYMAPCSGVLFGLKIHLFPSLFPVIV